MTANHGCDGVGGWFAVGPRTLSAGEQVGVKVSTDLRGRLCLVSHRGCRRIVVKSTLVFPVNCWNPNLGHVEVALYVRRREKPKRGVKPAHESKPPAPLPTPTPTVTVTPASTPTPAPAPVSTPTPTPAQAPTPAADPAASAAQLTCAEGAAVVVTLSNAASATASASFTVDGESRGPLAPGTSEELTIPLSAPGATATVTVLSGSSTLIGGDTFANECVAKPFAKATFVEGCQEKQHGLYEYEVELGNEASASWPASLELEWTGLEDELDKSEYTLAPGRTEVVTIVVGPRFLAEGPEEGFLEEPARITVTSGGRTILSEEGEAVFFGC